MNNVKNINTVDWNKEKENAVLSKEEEEGEQQQQLVSKGNLVYFWGRRGVSAPLLYPVF